MKNDLLRLFPDLRRLGPGAYVVGGAIRDLFRNEKPADVDVACPDPLACAERLGRKVIRLGKDHLSAYRVVADPHVYDFAEILDGDIVRDLARRDFTVNSMAVDLASGDLLDPHDARGDLTRRLVRMVDPANFDDDPLRLLKGVRLAVTLAFDIDGPTLAAIRQRAEAITSVAPERVTYELSIIFSAGVFRHGLGLLRATALDVPIFGCELNPSAYATDDVTLSAAFALIVNEPRRYAERWRWSGDLLRDVLTIQRLLGMSGDLRVALYDAGEPAARSFVSAARALGREVPLALPDFSLRPLLSGTEIAALTGLPPGPALGARKRALLEAQIRGEVHDRDAARDFVLRP